jgi:hypothetical protein
MRMVVKIWESNTSLKVLGEGDWFLRDSYEMRILHHE